MQNIRSLSELRVGDIGYVEKVNLDDGMKKRLFDLGLVTGTKIQAILQSPTGNPIAYSIRGALIALRKEDTAQIYVSV